MDGNGCRGRAWSCIALLALVATCSSNNTSPPPKGAILDPCTADDQCASGLFCATISSAGRCTAACASNTDCPARSDLECGVLADGTQACLPECDLASLLTGFACVDGVPTSCDRLGDEHCAFCGCSPELTCLMGTGCVPPSDVDGPCDSDEDCRSNNCSTFAGVCRVPLGTPCSSSDCDYCLDGWYCSRECNGQGDCQGGHCLGSEDSNRLFEYYCLPPCHPAASDACHGAVCELHPDALHYYCDCGRFSSSCPGTHAPRTIGQNCRNDLQCGSAARCLGTASGDQFFGYCSVACTSSTECGAGLACMAIAPCDPNSTCEGLCRPTCDVADPCARGTCDNRLATDGTRIDVCVF